MNTMLIAEQAFRSDSSLVHANLKANNMAFQSILYLLMQYIYTADVSSSSSKL